MILVDGLLVAAAFLLDKRPTRHLIDGLLEAALILNLPALPMAACIARYVIELSPWVCVPAFAICIWVSFHLVARLLEHLAWRDALITIR